MSEKTEQKRQLIIDKAREVFSTCGFRNVTMKDIVEACEISRGGLYLYFSSTEELLQAVLLADEEKEKKNDEYSGERIKGASSAELLLLFFKEQKKEILKKKNSMTVAKYEYAFLCREAGKTNSLKKEFETAALVLEKLLERGNASGEFLCEDPREEAGSIMLTIEGMKVCARTMGISEKRVDRELLFLLKKFMIVE